jgi:voltage-gated potassium channel
MKMRQLIQGFFNNHEASWEIFMVVLAVLFVVIGFLPDFHDFSDSDLSLLDTIDWGITGFFALEFIVRITVAPSQRKYLREHWLDLVAITPVVRWLRVFRVIRILRLLRVARVIRVLNSLDLFTLNVERFAKLNGLQWMLLALSLIMLASSGLLFYFEHPVNDEIKTYWDALYASLVTWTTPGYGDILPITTGGRISGLVLIISGLITWGLLIANLAVFLTACGARKRDTDPVITDLQNRLSRIDQLGEGELICLRGALTALIDSRIEKTRS